MVGKKSRWAPFLILSILAGFSPAPVAANDEQIQKYIEELEAALVLCVRSMRGERISENLAPFSELKRVRGDRNGDGGIFVVYETPQDRVQLSYDTRSKRLSPICKISRVYLDEKRSLNPQADEAMVAWVRNQRNIIIDGIEFREAEHPSVFSGRVFVNCNIKDFAVYIKAGFSLRGRRALISVGPSIEHARSC